MLRSKRSAPPESTNHRAGDAGSNPPSPTTPEDLSADAPNSSAPPSSKAAAAAAVSPNPKRAKSSSSPPSGGAGSGSATSRRSRRKRKPREEFPRQQQKFQQKVWAANDEESLLKAVVAFRSRTGALPRQATISEFFDGVKGSISPYITLEQVRYKLKRLKSKYINRSSAGLGSSATAHDRLVNKLSAEIWAAGVKPVVEEDGVLQAGQVDATPAQAEEGEDEEEEEGGEEDEEEEEEEEDVAREEDEEEFPFIREAAEKYWNELGGHYGAFVSNAMKQIDPVKGKALEQKLKKQCEEETLLLAKRLDLLKEMSQIVVTASRTTKL